MSQSVKNRYKKKCGICGKMKEVVVERRGGAKSEFGFRKKKRKDGTVAVYVKYMCNDCDAERVARWRKEKAEAGELKEAQRQWEATRKARLAKSPKKRETREVKEAARKRKRRAEAARAASRPVFLLAAPLVDWLRSLAPSEELDNDYYSREYAAERRLLWPNSAINWVSMEVADAILLAHDRTDLMARLWTEEQLSGRPYWEEHSKVRAA